MFSTLFLPKTNFNFSTTFNLSSPNGFNLKHLKFCRLKKSYINGLRGSKIRLHVLCSLIFDLRSPQKKPSLLYDTNKAICYNIFPTAWLVLVQVLMVLALVVHVCLLFVMALQTFSGQLLLKNKSVSVFTNSVVVFISGKFVRCL